MAGQESRGLAARHHDYKGKTDVQITCDVGVCEAVPRRHAPVEPVTTLGIVRRVRRRDSGRTFDYPKRGPGCRARCLWATASECNERVQTATAPRAADVGRSNWAMRVECAKRGAVEGQ